MTVDSLVSGLCGKAPFSSCVASIRHFPAKEAEYGVPGHALPPGITTYLEQKRISLYSHQTAALQAFRERKNFILTSSTASGKTLAFLLPIFEQLAFDPAATALFIYPTKALAYDQLKVVQEISRQTGIVARPAVYDGDTPRDRRPEIRRSSRMILTNPHELHYVLPWHHQWSAFLSGICCVVIDEGHRYRGVFGSHVALLFRRLRRICTSYKAEPVFIISSATLANPGEFAEKLCGSSFTTLSEDGAPHGERHFVLYNPYSDGLTDRSFHRESAGVMLECVRHHVPALAFTGSRTMAELVALWSREGMIRERLGSTDEIASYRAGYLPEDRRSVENRLKSGALKGVVSTNALEVGIDIGSLEGVILAGYPGTMMATWQQVGRAGRNSAESAAILVASANPLDQYFMRHPDLFFGRPNEWAIIDLANPYILSGQVLCAAAELPLQGTDSSYFGPELDEALAGLRDQHLLSETKRGFVYSGSRRPHELVSLGSSASDSFKVVSEGRTLETMDRGQAFREAHRGAVLLHQGEQYLVEGVDLLQGIIRVKGTDVDYYTRPLKSVDIRIIETRETRQSGKVILSFGTVEVTEQYYAYKIIRNDAILGVEPLDLPPLTFMTRSLWFQPPAGLEAVVRDADAEGGLHGVEHAFIAMMPFHVLCDRWDIGGISMPVHPETGEPVIFIYDGHPGGIGLSEKAYQLFEEISEKTCQLVRECPCEAGCPSCIYSPKCGNDNQPLDKEATIRILEAICRDESKSGGEKGHPLSPSDL
jgi:DEAD/DEAH box helicase domain-containing protein